MIPVLSCNGVYHHFYNVIMILNSVTLNLQGELAHVSLKHLKQNDLVYVSGLLNSYHKVDPSGEKHTFYKVCQ